MPKVTARAIVALTSAAAALIAGAALANADPVFCRRFQKPNSSKGRYLNHGF